MMYGCISLINLVILPKEKKKTDGTELRHPCSTRVCVLCASHADLACHKNANSKDDFSSLHRWNKTKGKESREREKWQNRRNTNNRLSCIVVKTKSNRELNMKSWSDVCGVVIIIIVVCIHFHCINQHDAMKMSCVGLGLAASATFWYWYVEKLLLLILMIINNLFRLICYFFFNVVILLKPFMKSCRWWVMTYLFVRNDVPS